MQKLIRIICLCLLMSFPLLTTQADHHEGQAATIMTEQEVEATLAQGLANLAGDRNVSDIVMRHVDVGEEHLGVSVVQRNHKEAGGPVTGIAHPDLDEIYYIVAGEGTMLTGGELMEKTSRVSALLGPIESGEIRGAVQQKVKVGDIAIIPKGMPHGWHEIPSENISYIIFRGDPNKVMDLKYD